MSDNSTLNMQIEYYIRQRIDETLDEIILPNIEQLVVSAQLCQSDLGKSQFSSLQNLLRETNSIQVVFNWIRYQMGRYKNWNDHHFGSALLRNLNMLENIAKEIVAEIYNFRPEALEQEAQQDREIRRLIRQVWKQLIEQYVGQLYRSVVACKGTGR